MYQSLFDNFFSETHFSPMRTIYVISDSQLEDIKLQQRKEELKNLESSRKSLEKNYQSRLKIIDEREHELHEELKILASGKNTSKSPAEVSKECAAKT